MYNVNLHFYNNSCLKKKKEKGGLFDILKLKDKL